MGDAGDCLEQKLRELVCLNAPVITGLKPCGIISVSEREYFALSRLFSGGAISLLPLYSGRRVTFLFYREERLSEQLSDPELRAQLLELAPSYGEFGPTLSALLRHFRERYLRYKRGEQGFPHELGLFLGYPAADVRGYLLHAGTGAKLCGYWKVYGDVRAALRTFQAYDVSVQSFFLMAGHGVPLEQLLSLCPRRESSVA